MHETEEISTAGGNAVRSAVQFSGAVGERFNRGNTENRSDRPGNLRVDGMAAARTLAALEYTLYVRIVYVDCSRLFEVHLERLYR